ncbi:MAG: ADP-ribose pyrophosphatase [candidate division TM6 bacterium GW2011_GWF2_30_66]|jgi:ADP-ribose pyrophosphatase YjhB (NUDIX family)|nr:MAG: ADP-ribose pyrophosphatase [candidate division TM6 bacterium GW2011_GWF2_30_66]
MIKERFKIGTYVTVILRKGEDVLLIRRAKTGSYDGFYSLPGGGVDGNEPVTQAVAREALEEVGIKVKQEDLKVVHVLHTMHKEKYETVGFFIEAKEWEGQLQNMEPHKHDDLQWFPLNALPENTIPHLRYVIDKINDGVFYSEFGW